MDDLEKVQGVSWDPTPIIEHRKEQEELRKREKQAEHERAMSLREEERHREKRFQLVCAMLSNSGITLDLDWTRFWCSADAILAAEPPLPETPK